jgi:NTE family protein
MGKEYNIMALSGGAVKGVAYVGVFKKLEELINKRKVLESKPDFKESECKIPKINIKTICAVSVGTIFSLIYLIGFNYIEMLEEVLTKNFEQLKNIRIMNFATKFGLDSGENFINWLKELMKKKKFDPEIKLKDFYEKTNVDFQIMATNLNKYRYKKFNYIDTPDVKVLDAIRMSISIPFVFTTNEYEGDLYVDGGLIDNYPIGLFNNSLDKVLGFKLVNHGELESHDIDHPIDDIESFIYHILTCYVVQKEKHTSRREEFKKCTVYIHTENITQSVNFGLTAQEKHKLIEIGYRFTNDFFNKQN